MLWPIMDMAILLEAGRLYAQRFAANRWAMFWPRFVLVRATCALTGKNLFRFMLPKL